MKYKIFIFLSLVSFAFQSCTKEHNWTGNDVNFPIPVISSVSNTIVNVGDTIIMSGIFNEVTSVTIGGGVALIDSVTTDSTTMFVIVKETCSSGPLVVKNVYKRTGTYSKDIIVKGGGVVVVPDQVVILDFTTGGALPKWTKSTWKEARNFEETGYDLNNNISPPAGYKHYYAMNDTALADDGNTAYGNYTSDNDGSGFDISFYSDPYVSVLINTGSHCAYLSFVIDGDVHDFQPSNSPGGTFANGEKEHHMQTNGKWMWYTFSLSKVMGGEAPTSFTSAGIFIRAGWDYPADSVYPGFQLNIAQMVVTEGPLPKKTIVFDFENGEPTTTDAVTSWAGDALASYGLDKFGYTAPEGDHYYSMENHADGGGKNYKFAIKGDNDGQGYDLSQMKDPYISFAVNTGNSSGFLDFVFYQASSGNKEGEPWADPGAGNSALQNYPESAVNGFFYDTKGKWEWRSYNLIKLLNSVPDWGKQNGYPDFTSIFDYILVWPRDGWNNKTAAPPFELNIDDVFITDGVPTKADLPNLN